MPRSEKKKIEQVIAEMEKIAEQLALSQDIVDSAIQYFNLIRGKKYLAGCSLLLVAFGALYHVIKTDPGCPAISLEEFAEKTSYNRKKIYRIYSKIMQEEGAQPMICTLRPTIFVKKLGPEIGFTEGDIEKAIVLAKEGVKEKIHIGKSPLTVADACLCAISWLEKTGISLKEIAFASNVNEVSVRNILKGHPFFRKKEVEFKQVAHIDEWNLGLFIKKLIGLNRLAGKITFLQLRQIIRSNFPNELKGLAISVRQLYEVVQTLEAQDSSLVKLVPGSSCPNKQLDCNSCRERYTWFPSESLSSCPAMLVMFNAENRSKSSN
jgi:transcription initiation factor TFIIIB Brf1 subunit/transcription initiation factor TFIIB